MDKSVQYMITSKQKHTHHVCSYIGMYFMYLNYRDLYNRLDVYESVVHTLDYWMSYMNVYYILVQI